MKSQEYQAIKFKKNSKTIFNDQIVKEAPLQININGNPYTVVMRTPGDDLELIRGLLYAEDIYKEKQNLIFEIIDQDDNNFTIINLKIPKHNLSSGYLNKRTLLSVSSCGVCGTQTLDNLTVNGDKLDIKSSVNVNQISTMFNTMNKKQETFAKTGASHAASIFNQDFNILTLMEDIGRHNAVDKCIGDLINNNQLNKAKYLLVSGRVSYEIVTKSFIAKIPTIIAVSGCSSLSIDFAKEFGIQLIGYFRGNTYTIYNL